MEKRGQFFILGAIILCLALFVLMAKVNTYEERILLEDFPDLSENYKIESVKVVNDALLGGLDPTTKLSGFTAEFVGYARTIDPQIGFVNLYRDKETGQTYVDNYLGTDTPINIYTSDPESSTPTDALFSDETNSINDISLNINGLNFKKTIPVKVRNFDEGYGAGSYPGQIYLEIAGIFYPISIGTDFQVIARSESPSQIGVDIS